MKVRAVFLGVLAALTIAPVASAQIPSPSRVAPDEEAALLNDETRAPTPPGQGADAETEQQSATREDGNDTVVSDPVEPASPTAPVVPENIGAERAVDGERRIVSDDEASQPEATDGNDTRAPVRADAREDGTRTVGDSTTRDENTERREKRQKGKRYKKFGDPNPADATFLAVTSAAGSFAGGAVVLGTAAAVLYVYSNVYSNIVIYLPQETARQVYWWSLTGVAIVGISILAIPVGAAFGTWWGAGLRGLPLSLNDALINMAVGILMGASVGVTVMTPIGIAAAALSTGEYFSTGRGTASGIGDAFVSREVWALLVVPAVVTVSSVITGAVVGGVVGPVITGSRWGYWAEGEYVE